MKFTLSTRWPAMTMLRGRDRMLNETLTWADDIRALAVPKGFVCDLASVPRLLWWWMPPDGIYRAAVVIHDWDYSVQRVKRSVADWTMFCVMLHVIRSRSETRWRKCLRLVTATTMWLGVRVGGWVAWNRTKGADR